MKKYLAIGGLIGLVIGFNLLTGFPPLPVPFLQVIFLGFVWEWIVSLVGSVGGSDLVEGVGWLYFLFSAGLGVFYGYIIFKIKEQFSR